MFQFARHHVDEGVLRGGAGWLACAFAVSDQQRGEKQAATQSSSGSHYFHDDQKQLIPQFPFE
jgi:hypothetical protein